MSSKPIALEHVLAHQATVHLDLAHINADDLKRAARFWFGTTASNKFRKDDSIKALQGLFQDRQRIEAGLRSLTDDQREVLAVCKRHGGTVSGPLLLCELLARKLVVQPKPNAYQYGRRDEDVVQQLSDKLLLVSRHGYSAYSYSFSGYRLQYPDVVVHPAVLAAIESAEPLKWQPSEQATEPTVTFRRSAAEVALDLWTTAQALGQTGSWKTTKGGSLGKSVQNRLAKLFAWPPQDRLVPPAPEVLYYEILRGQGGVLIDGDQGHVNLAAIERQLRSPAPVQARSWVRAWLESRLWQDGIGVVPDRESYDNPVRIEPSHLHTARELLVWALCRAAHGPDNWLDLAIFVAGLWAETGEDAIRFYWNNYSWDPDFKLARNKHELSLDAGRRLAFWMDAAGTWAANAIMGTLAHLGLVERGHGASGPDSQPCFRLTAIGKAVFGAPEQTATEGDHEAKFLTVQPNHEVVVYLDGADAGAVWPLAQMARRVSSAGGLVQTFALTRDSVYQALESGLKLEQIQQFLTAHSRTLVPDNVLQSLIEWSRKRETLVLRMDVTLAAAPPGQTHQLPSATTQQQVGDQFLLLPGTRRDFKGLLVRNHFNAITPAWRVNEAGLVHIDKEADAVALARLSQFADATDKGWQISAASVRRAQSHGLTGDQIIGWLRNYLSNPLPAMPETAIRNWSSTARVFLGNLLLLQVPQAQACATILASERFQPLLVSHLPPDWFVVRPEKQEELEGLLEEMGFAVGGTCKLVGLADAAATRAEEEIESSERRPRRGRPRKKSR